MTGQDLAGVGVYCSWSGGKDSALALHEAVRCGAEPGLLVTMLTEGGQRSRSHGLDRRLLEAQAAACGVPVLFGSATWPGYTEAFRGLVAAAVARGLTTGVHGDIDVETHREWVESVAASAGARACLPLWRRSRRAVVDDLLRAGFEARLVAVRDGALPADLLGEAIDRGLLRRFERAGIDLAGENGEYHTLVVAGPLFREPLDVEFGETVLRDGVWFVDAQPAVTAAAGASPRSPGAPPGPGDRPGRPLPRPAAPPGAS